jgi:hypothetical protein
MKNWKTSLMGIAIIIAGVYVFISTKDYTQAGIAIAAGIGLLNAKDDNVTGGTVSQ